MKLSYNWLNDFVDLSDQSLEDLAHKLTMAAFEVEAIEPTREALGDDVVLGEILEIEKHPDADKLQVTKTSTGTETHQIVCGASNIKVGQKVPVAMVGSKVTNRHDGSELKIKKSKIRGVESCGMLCSPDELGLDETETKSIYEKQGDGIYILNDLVADTKLGTPISKALNFEIDYVLEVGARSNRGDALSVFGQARELSAILDKPLNRPFEKHNDKIYDADDSIASIEPRIADENDCSLFYTVSLEGVEIKESPQWLKDRINAMGTKSINNVVDISNYVLLELGQPMHFYDREKISGAFLEVRRAKKGEELKTLEEKTCKLDEVNMLIADKAGPSSLAGVMGGMASSINDNTQNIVIEVAVFNPAVVRRSSRAAGVESESKRRFERGVDKSFSRKALMRAIELLAQLAAPEGKKLKVGAIQIAGSEKTDEKTVDLRFDQVKRLLGVEIEKQEIISLLSTLDFKLLSDKEPMSFAIPCHRQLDVTREADLIEEIGRLYGFDKIPAQVPGSSVTVITDKKIDTRTQRQVRDLVRSTLVAAGFSEVQLSSLIGDTLVDLDKVAFDFLHDKAETLNAIAMDNPLSREHRVLRQSMLPGLIQAASRNYAYDKTVDIKLFELGQIYYFDGDKEKASRDMTTELPRLAAVLVKTEHDWTQSKPKTLAENFFYFKSIVENLYPNTKISALDLSDESIVGNQLVHPGISGLLTQGKKVLGIIAKAHPSLTKEWDLPDETYIMELQHPNLKKIKFKPIATTPIVERDITVDSKDDLTSQEILDILTKKASQELKGVKLVSLFRRDPSKSETDPNAVKSTTFRLKWQSASETLSGEVIDAEIAKLKDLLESSLGVTFRA